MKGALRRLTRADPPPGRRAWRLWWAEADGADWPAQIDPLAVHLDARRD